MMLHAKWRASVSNYGIIQVDVELACIIKEADLTIL